MVSYSSLEPFVVRSEAVERWPLFRQDVGELCGDASLTARFIPRRRSPNKMLWETECERRRTTAAAFVAWALGEAGPLAEAFPVEAYAAYVDYTHLLTALPDASPLVDWSPFGVAADGDASTLWLGSRGAHTPTHADSYGFNLHAQLRGRKRWIVWPPSDGAALGRTRLPYEESSVWALRTPASAALEATSPRAVTLSRGDVLFLPPHWWHLVICVSEEPALSVNTWVGVAGDAAARRGEAVTRAAVALLEDGGLLPDRLGLLPSEPSLSLDVALRDLRRVLRTPRPTPEAPRSRESPSSSQQARADDNTGSPPTQPSSPPSKRLKTEDGADRASPPRPTDEALERFVAAFGGKGAPLARLAPGELREEWLGECGLGLGLGLGLGGECGGEAEGEEEAEEEMDRYEFIRRLLNSIDVDRF